MMKRLHLIISGDVVGVGLRTWIKVAAIKLHLVGWVKNRPDDTVEVIAEGKEEDLKTFSALCHKGPSVAWVEHVEETWEEYQNEFDIFEVVH